jgi:hypothetical protein
MKTNGVETEMTISANDLKRVPTNALRGYLAALGFAKVKERRTHSVWECAAKGEREGPQLLVPHEPRADYASVVLDFVRTLVLWENRPETDILADLTNRACDTLRLRLFHPRIEISSIRVSQFKHLGQCVEQLVVAAVKQAGRTSPKRLDFLPSRQDFLEKVRMDHSEHGSYIVIARIPLGVEWGAFEPPQELLFQIPEEPFARMTTEAATLTLDKAKATAIQVEGGASSSIWRDAALTSGFTAPLSDSISQILESGVSLDARLSFTPVLPHPNFQVVFEPTQSGIFKTAADVIRGIKVYEGHTLTGPIVSLSRDPELPNQAEVQIRAKLEGQDRHIRIPVNEGFYKAAVDSLLSPVQLRVTGRLLVEGKRARMTNLTSFSAVEVQQQKLFERE